MNRIAKASSLTLLALLVLTLPIAAQVDVSGSWLIEVAAPDGTVQESSVELSQDGTKVTGSVPNPMTGGTETAEGEIEGNRLTFMVSYSMNSQPVTIEVSAEVDGDTMAGTIMLGQMGAIPFTGKRQEG